MSLFDYICPALVLGSNIKLVEAFLCLSIKLTSVDRQMKRGCKDNLIQQNYVTIAGVIKRFYTEGDG